MGFVFSSAKTADDLLHVCYIRPQLRTELVSNVTGPGQRTKGDHFDISKVDQSGKRYSRSMETSSRQKTCSSTNCASVPGLFLLLWLPWVYKFSWTSATSFFFCASACALASSSTLLKWHRGFSEDGAKAESNL